MGTGTTPDNEKSVSHGIQPACLHYIRHPFCRRARIFSSYMHRDTFAYRCSLNLFLVSFAHVRHSFLVQFISERGFTIVLLDILFSMQLRSPRLTNHRVSLDTCSVLICTIQSVIEVLSNNYEIDYVRNYLKLN